MKQSIKYIAAGVVVSNLIYLFIGSLVFAWFWRVDELNQGIALVLMFTIIMTTLCSAVASYFWSHTGIPLKKLRWLAIANHIWVLFLFLLHPSLGVGNVTIQQFLLYNFFSKAALAIIIFCSLLGNWFGRRVFYE